MPYADPEKRREAKRRYREANRELIRERNREYARRKRGVETVGPWIRHGLYGHPLYQVWKGMMARCNNAKDPRYHRYGGRGIAVCERWHDMRLFVEDIDCLLGPRPVGLTLDRLDNDGNYEPGNVRWATPKQQQRHRQRGEHGQWA